MGYLLVNVKIHSLLAFLETLTILREKEIVGSCRNSGVCRKTTFLDDVLADEVLVVVVEVGVPAGFLEGNFT